MNCPHVFGLESPVVAQTAIQKSRLGVENVDTAGLKKRRKHWVGLLSVFILSSNVCIFWFSSGCRDFSTERPYHRALSFVIVDIAFVCLVTGLTSLKRKMWCLAYHVFGNCRIRVKSENSNLISKKRDTFISKFVLWIPWIINSN